jgi:hypothetical protein
VLTFVIDGRRISTRSRRLWYHATSAYRCRERHRVSCSCVT